MECFWLYLIFENYAQWGKWPAWKIKAASKKKSSFASLSNEWILNLTGIFWNAITHSIAHEFRPSSPPLQLIIQTSIEYDVYKMPPYKIGSHIATNANLLSYSKLASI